MKRTSNYALRLPYSLKNAIENFAKQDGTTINQFIVIAAAEKLAVLQTENYFAERAKGADIDAFIKILTRDGGQPPAPEDRLPEGFQRPSGA